MYSGTRMRSRQGVVRSGIARQPPNNRHHLPRDTNAHAVPLVLILLSHREEIMGVGCIMATAFKEHPAIDLAPDKALLLTAAHRYALVDRGLLLTERMSTLVHYGANADAGDDDVTRHPVTWRSLRATDKVCVHSGRRIVHKRLSFPEALADAVLPANSSLFMRKVHLEVANVPELLLKLQADLWKV